MIENIKNSAVKKVTLADIAEKAGVGVATVDRVINDRAAVSMKTKQKVFLAAQALGYHGLSLIKQQLGEDLEVVKLGFILQRRESKFYRELENVIIDACASWPNKKVIPVVEYLEELTPRSTVRALESLRKQVRAVALVAADHPKVTQAVDETQALGVPVFTLLTDLSSQHRAGYVGIDNRSAGRTAAWAITQLAKSKGKIGIIMGSHRYLCQELCEVSFRSFCRENAPQFHIVEAVTSLEHKSLAEDAALELLKQNPDLVALYCAGGGVEGVLDAIRDMPMAKDMIIVANELTEVTKAALVDGALNMVISHPRVTLANTLVKNMLANEFVLTGRNQPDLLAFDIHISENV